MDIQTIINALESLAVVVLGGLAIYFKTSKKAKTKAKEIQETLVVILGNVVAFINEAEDQYKSYTNKGSEKFEMVVDKLYSLVPDSIKGIIDREMIADMVQRTFDEVEDYVKMQLDDGMDKVKTEEDTAETPAEEGTEEEVK